MAAVLRVCAEKMGYFQNHLDFVRQTVVHFFFSMEVLGLEPRRPRAC